MYHYAESIPFYNDLTVHFRLKYRYNYPWKEMNGTMGRKG